ncbi:MAG: SUMF1/EgtB/PvdO family nonheme iron enzyme [Myxococcales bacterium]|nr:SUMF1/EgtB/PvdO family nonheme iron enzyme [Myxococcales bacterium]
MRLSMACIGVGSDLEQGRTCDPLTGELAPLAMAGAAPPLVVGSWPGAKVGACSSVAPEGMVCVPGGAFLLGDATRAGLGGADKASVPEHLVVLPSFHLDREELTVGRLRALLSAHPELTPPQGKTTGSSSLFEFCSFDPSGTNDALPANCLDWHQAAAYCAARGARLPTEAEWEFAAANRDAETLYPWGDSDDLCAIAIVERGPSSAPSGCRITASGVLDPGPVVGGGPLDFTQLGIHDLGGSLLEWVQDSSDRYDGECWAKAGALEDPVCSTSGPDAVVRGGSFADLGIDARAAGRRHAPRTGVSGALGVRCAAD